jgi:hypothetical protein
LQNGGLRSERLIPLDALHPRTAYTRLIHATGLVDLLSELAVKSGSDKLQYPTRQLPSPRGMPCSIEPVHAAAREDIYFDSNENFPAADDLTMAHPYSARTKTPWLQNLK